MPSEDMAARLQIKSKFGGLRVSYRNSDQMPRAGSKIEAIVDEAKKQARLTCAVCGAPGRPHEDLGMDPLCTPCTTLRLATRKGKR